MLTKLLKGSPLRKSRLHDHKGQIVPALRMIKNLPRALITGVLRIAVSARPRRPWISYDATKVLSSFLDRKKTVLEFGSGMSTLWYAQHAGKVVSIESNRAWYDKMSAIIRKHGLSNIDYRLIEGEDTYANVPEGYEDFDLIMVDGSLRDHCTQNAIERLKPGGIYYLDNSDRMAFPDSAEARAGRIALGYAQKHGCAVAYFTDFAPTQFFAQEGLMVTRPNG